MFANSSCDFMVSSSVSVLEEDGGVWPWSRLEVGEVVEGEAKMLVGELGFGEVPGSLDPRSASRL